VTEKDEDRAVPEETPATAAGDAVAILGELAGRFDKVEGQLSEFHRRSAHRESLIDRLHEENQRLRGGISRAVLEPVVADLIRLYDQLSREAHRLGTGGQADPLLWSFAEDVAQILDRCGYEVFSAEPGDPFLRERHRPLAVVPCDDESRHNTVAEVVAAGFAERGTGRVRRPLHARFHQYSPRRDTAPDSPETGPPPGQAHSQ
jgi:molecular chaperone GrpE (heat shock protein)